MPLFTSPPIRMKASGWVKAVKLARAIHKFRQKLRRFEFTLAIDAVQKTTSGPVNSTKIDQTLRVLGIDTVIVAGVATDVCVAQTTREFGDRDFDAIVVSDACATFDQSCHDAALQTIGATFGTVLSTDEAVASLGAV